MREERGKKGRGRERVEEREKEGEGERARKRQGKLTLSLSLHDTLHPSSFLSLFPPLPLSFSLPFSSSSTLFPSSFLSLSPSFAFILSASLFLFHSLSLLPSHPISHHLSLPLSLSPLLSSQASLFLTLSSSNSCSCRNLTHSLPVFDVSNEFNTFSLFFLYSLCLYLESPTSLVTLSYFVQKLRDFNTRKDKIRHCGA